MVARSSDRRLPPTPPLTDKEVAADARDTTDDDLQEQRLNRALANYGLAVQAASPETDRLLLSRAHEAMGRILAFLERREDALKEFDAAIQITDASCEAYSKAIEAKRKLAQP